MQSRKLLFILLLLVVIIAVLLSELIHSSGPNRVVFILLDAARADRLSMYGYKRNTTPNIDRLAKRGVIFTNHFSQATWTRLSIPSIFYSRYFIKPILPASHHVLVSSPRLLFQDLDPASVSLTDLLSANGFRTCMISAQPWLNRTSFIGKQFDEAYTLHADLKFSNYLGHLKGSDVIDHTIQWIRKSKDSRFFLYIHLMDTHFPHFLEEDAKQFLKEEGLSAQVPARFMDSGKPKDGTDIVLNPSERKYLDAVYDGDLRYVDRQLGRLFNFLNDNQMLEDTLIVITSDHGENLLELPGRWEHSDRWHDTVARVPLIVFYPKKLRPRRVTFLTESVDTVPTILGLMSIPLSKGKRFDGTNLIETLNSKSRLKKYVYSENAMRDERYKCYFNLPASLLLDLNSKSPVVPISSIPGELYDLKNDPLETKNIWKDHLEIVTEMLEVYRNRMSKRYLRMVNSKTNQQPEVPFAIGAMSFRIKNDQQGEWTRQDYTQIHALSGTAGAHVELQFPIPNGFYLVSAHALGSGDLKLQQAEDWIALRSQNHPGGEETDLLKVEDFPLGIVQITGEVFHAEIRIPENQSFLITRFGFIPSPDRKQQREMDKDAEEKLRALGYIR